MLYLSLSVASFLLALFFLVIIRRVGQNHPPKPPDVQAPLEFLRVGSRRWARACYYNKLISLQELAEFCRTHPDEE